MILIYVITTLLRYACAQGGNTGNCPSGYTVHYDYPNLCIYVESISQLEWQQATCPYGGSLVLPYNSLIHDYVTSLLDTFETYYFGLNISNGGLLWQDGVMLLDSFDVWAYPVIESERCGYYFYNSIQWEWDTTICNESKLFICQYVIPNISPNVRLLDGVYEGRVEIYHDNRWGTITHTNPPASLGVVICDMLNLTFVDYNVSSNISDGTGIIWLDGVNCTALLSTVDLCAENEHIAWGLENVPHTSDVKVRCQESVPVCNTFDLPPVAYAGQSCTGVSSINCTVTCVTLPNGSVYLHTNGLKSMSYSCLAATGVWTPTLPPLECELSLINSSSTVCMPATTMTETITDTITTSMTGTVTMTTMQTLQPSQCIQTTAQSVQTYSHYTPTQTVSLISSSTVCMPTTTTTATTTTETITDTITTSITDTVTLTTMQTLQPSLCIQTTAQSVQTYSHYTPTQTDIQSQSVSPSSVIDGNVQPTTTPEGPLLTPKYSKRTSAMFSTATKKDNRPTAIAIGSIGVVILASLLGSVLFLDMITIGKERLVFPDVRKTPKRPNRQRRSPDGRESKTSIPETASGLSSVISLNESDNCPSEVTENASIREELQNIGIAQIHPTPHGMKPEVFPLSTKLLDIPVPNLCIPSYVDTGHIASFPSRPFIADVLDIPSPFTYQEPGESVEADLEMDRFTRTTEHLPSSPCPEALYDN